MVDQDFKAKFEAATSAFLAPILAAGQQNVTQCRVYTIFPEDRASDDTFSLPLEEFASYMRFTLGQGFRAVVRLVSASAGSELHIITWEGARTALAPADWPAHDGQVVASWEWTGFPAAG